jgi:hypothetical protein
VKNNKCKVQETEGVWVHFDCSKRKKILKSESREFNKHKNHEGI